MAVSGWRLVKRKYADDAFSGAGCDFVAGRWQFAGLRMVYGSVSLSTAILELVAHGFDFLEVGTHFVAFRFTLPGDSVKQLLGSDLERDIPHWRNPVPSDFTRNLGAGWLKSQETAALVVPSAVIPLEPNVLLNPLHPGCRSLQIEGPFDVPVDVRLI